MKRAIDGKPFNWDKLDRTATMSKADRETDSGLRLFPTECRWTELRRLRSTAVGGGHLLGKAKKRRKYHALPDTHDSEASLFPILPAALTGMAQSGCRVPVTQTMATWSNFEPFRSAACLTVRSPTAPGWMDYSINPYRGCEFGCRYCYARYTHEFLSPAKASRRNPCKPSRAH